MRVGFIGLGNMGAPMAASLAGAGHAVRGFDAVPAAVERACAGGVGAADGIAAACADAEAVVTMLPAGPQVDEVYLGEGGILDAAPGGALLVDASTIDVATARRVAAEAAGRGLLFLDAPVSGGVAGAENAALTFMVGGGEEAFARADPLFGAMGRKAVHAGAAGAGQAAKACNNMLLGISMVGLAEAFTLGERLGLDPAKLFEICSSASGSSWAMLNHLPVPGIVPTAAANDGFQPGFAAAMMLKDLTLAQAAAQAEGVATPLGAAARAVYEMFAAAGGGDLDYAGVIRLIRGGPVSS